MKQSLRLLLVLSILFVLSVPTVLTQDDCDSWWAEAAAPYAGTTIRGISESTPPSAFVSDVLAPQFTACTGIEVEFEITSWDQMYNNAINDMQAGTGIYDFVYIEQDIVYAYLARDFLVDLTQFTADNPDLAYEGFSFDNFNTFIDYFKDAEEHVFGIPMEAFIKVYAYRTDLFEDPDIMAAFETEYGYALAPATTHDQYRDISEFFTAYGAENDMELWGTTVQAANGHPASWYEWQESWGPTFGVYNWGLNQDTFTATVENGGNWNSDTAVEGFQYWLDLLAFAPPESTQSTWDETAATFAAGRVAQGLIYGENVTWIATDEDRSQVIGNVGVALPPLADGVLEAAEAGEGYIGYYDGGAFGIPHSSDNIEATALWLQFIGQESVQADWAVAGGRIVMDSTFDDPLVQEFDAATNGYFTLLQESGYLFAGAPPFPFHAQVREISAPFFYQAITGDITAQEALNSAAEAADQTLIDLGYAQ